ncbi:MAG TPA: hypothetical protein VJP86_06340 [Vicinamibacterales bacterium]|jgi:hypothetical protein|nr:hypothetical protein [Vicinamibacterales bacterium]
MPTRTAHARWEGTIKEGKANCPVPQALAGTNITLQETLAGE